MTDLLLLADRVEKAAAGSRELDAEIAIALGLPWDYRAEWRGWGYDKHGAAIEKPVAFPFTSRLTAAMSLAPESAYWLFGKGKTRPDEPLFAFQILDHGGTVLAESESDIRECCIVAAALRSRANGSAG